jgi:fructokinase
MPEDARPEFVVVGEAIIDVSGPAADGSYSARPGGSPLNVAIGLARLGQPVAFAGRLSDDPLSAVLRRHLRASGVGLRHAAEAQEPSTVALVDLAGGQATYQFSAHGADFGWRPGDLDFLPAGGRVVHFGSLASWLPPGAVAVTGAIRRVREQGSALVSYDPNVRPALQPDPVTARRQVEASVALAHLVKASSDDLRWLYGPQPAGQPAERWLSQVAARWLELGPGLVVVTTGPGGATAWTRAHQPAAHQPAAPATVVDTIGAGDAFTSGLLDAFARRGLLGPAGLGQAGHPSAEPSVLGPVLDEASLVASITCSRPGADPPTRAEVDAARRTAAH